MKRIIILTIIFATYTSESNAQVSPCFIINNSYQPQNTNNIRSTNDTITFSSLTAGTLITSQYLSNGVVFSGYSGSTAPKIYNYGAPTYYGNVLISDNWYNPLRINFTDTSNASIYHLAKKIEFDNIVDYAGEVDFMSIDVYDSVNILIYHYLSASPEHVVLNFTTPMAAYITIDDSAGTAFVVDNILIDYWSPSSKDSNSNTEFFIPNVFTPNNDGQNDFFEIKANGYKSYLLKIYNRWGQLIFSSNNESNYWNGKIKHTNKDASDGTYYYILELINNIDKYSSYKGLLTLLRDK